MPTSCRLSSAPYRAKLTRRELGTLKRLSPTFCTCCDQVGQPYLGDDALESRSDLAAVHGPACGDLASHAASHAARHAARHAEEQAGREAGLLGSQPARRPGREVAWLPGSERPARQGSAPLQRAPLLPERLGLRGRRPWTRSSPCASASRKYAASRLARTSLSILTPRASSPATRRSLCPWRRTWRTGPPAWRRVCEAADPLQAVCRCLPMSPSSAQTPVTKLGVSLSCVHCVRYTYANYFGRPLQRCAVS